LAASLGEGTISPAPIAQETPYLETRHAVVRLGGVTRRAEGKPGTRSNLKTNVLSLSESDSKLALHKRIRRAGRSASIGLDSRRSIARRHRGNQLILVNLNGIETTSGLLVPRASDWLASTVPSFGVAGQNMKICSPSGHPNHRLMRGQVMRRFAPRYRESRVERRTFHRLPDRLDGAQMRTELVVGVGEPLHRAPIVWACR
jgi:hypothetical protein